MRSFSAAHSPALPPGSLIYEIYPRSFQADTGGTGSINGIRHRLPYLAELGVRVIWLTPFFPSPMADFGYDVADYCNVDPLFGSLQELEHLVAEAADWGIELMGDLVGNHTSNQHAWFIEACSSRDAAKRDWYIWRDPAPDGGPPNNWLAVFGGSAWQFHEPTGQYYLHSFLAEQPDLNWENPEVQQAMQQVLRFWADLGIRLWRVDAIDWAGKDVVHFRDNPPNPNYQPGGDPYHSQQQLYTIRMENHFRYLKILAEVLRETNGFMIVETYPPGEDLAAEYRHILDNYATDVASPLLLSALIYQPFTAQKLRDNVHAVMDQFESGETPVWIMGTHDVSRVASRLPDPEAARTAAMLIMLLPGISVLYYGEEIGMSDGVILPHQVCDPFEKRVPGRGLGRDPNRTPMQWSRQPYAGFSQVTPWLPIPESYRRVNVENQQSDARSMLSLYRQLAQLRSEPVVRDGAYRPLAVDHDQVFAFERTLGETRFLVVLNISGTSVTCNIGPGKGELVLSTQLDLPQNMATTLSAVMLRPWEGWIIRLSS